MRKILIMLAFALATTPAAQAADIAGSKDPSFLKRFEGAEIFAYVDRSYDRIIIYDSSGYAGDSHETPVEGAVTRIFYRIPPGYTALEVLRNYEEEVQALGMKQTSELLCSNNAADGVIHAFYGQISVGKMDNPFGYAQDFTDLLTRPNCYMAAKGVVQGKMETIAVVIGEKHKMGTVNDNDGKPMTFKDGEIIVAVDVATSKAVVNQMVVVKASDMADALAAKGVVDLYGIYFDTDKTEVKPESTATLDEVASLLKIDRSLKLEISGHTDNTGAKDHNVKLSQGRADAVMAVLVKKYGIDPKRLSAKGYGDTKPIAPNTTEDGKAKNRRVELRKI
jgi:outer membrane protein OmpA-like peptidoglycan-associated protein